VKINSYNFSEERLNIASSTCCSTNINRRRLGSETVRWNSFNSHNGKERKVNEQSWCRDRQNCDISTYHYCLEIHFQHLIYVVIQLNLSNTALCVRSPASAFRNTGCCPHSLRSDNRRIFPVRTLIAWWL